MSGAMAKGSFNMRNPAVKRILQEVKEMNKEDCKDYMSMPLEEDIFEWQFAIHGPKDSEFEGGIYHGRITLPAEYPFKPPSFMLLTPSGRWETQTKICLSISNHHPEHWQPSWSVRTALVALIAFMPTKPNGALGSLEYTKKERRALAIKSRLTAPQFGSPERQKIIQQIHEAMLRTAPPVPTTVLVEDEPSGPAGAEEGGRAALAPAPAPPLPNLPTPAPPAPAAPGQKLGKAVPSTSTAYVAGRLQQLQNSSKEGSSLSTSSFQDTQQAVGGSSAPMSAATTQPLQAPDATAAVGQHTTGAGTAERRPAAAAAAPVAAATRLDAETAQERLLSLAAVVLVLAIMFILGQKIARAYNGLAFTGGDSEL